MALPKKLQRPVNVVAMLPKESLPPPTCTPCRWKKPPQRWRAGRSGQDKDHCQDHRVKRRMECRRSVRWSPAGGKV